MRISDWSSDLCSSDLLCIACGPDLWLRTDSTKARRFVMALARLGSAKKCSISSSSVDFPWVLHMVYAIHGRAPGSDVKKIGSASCRDRGWQYVSISVGAVVLKKKNKKI